MKQCAYLKLGGGHMPETVSIGTQDFEKLRKGKNFYIDKTLFIKEWWEAGDDVTLITRPRRFGKTLNMSMVEELLKGNTFLVELDEQIVFSDLDEDENAIWSLLVASGYLKVVNREQNLDTGVCIYELKLTNNEVRFMFQNMIKGWFSKGSRTSYNNFIKALLQNDLDAMNEYMNDVSEQIFSSFDTGKHPSQKQQPERFYHGFVLGLLVDLRDRYLVTSNRESGFGRYDVILEPLQEGMDAIILEFKIHKPKKEDTIYFKLYIGDNQHFSENCLFFTLCIPLKR